MAYFLIHNLDGDTRVDSYTKEELLQEIDEGEWSEGFFEAMPKDQDTNYWGYRALLIKGEIIVPKPKETVIKYELD